MNTYKKMYLNRISFCYIALGYFLGVFGNIDHYNKLLIAVFVVVLALLIIILSRCIVALVVKHSKIANIEITPKELERLGIKPSIESIPDEELNEILD